MRAYYSIRVIYTTIPQRPSVCTYYDAEKTVVAFTYNNIFQLKFPFRVQSYRPDEDEDDDLHIGAPHPAAANSHARRVGGCIRSDTQ